jgi:hypothetical protein
MTINEQLGQEWIALQNNYEQYEKGGLLIKLISLVLTAIGFTLDLNAVLVCALVAILWMQEGIFRTFQSRLGQRILRVESLVKQGASVQNPAFQLHSEWLENRKGALGLLGEYAASASKPTVAFPYAVLLMGIVTWMI